jgi:hypothetical protein
VQVPRVRGWSVLDRPDQSPAGVGLGW